MGGQRPWKGEEACVHGPSGRACDVLGWSGRGTPDRFILWNETQAMASRDPDHENEQQHQTHDERDQETHALQPARSLHDVGDPLLQRFDVSMGVVQVFVEVVQETLVQGQLVVDGQRDVLDSGHVTRHAFDVSVLISHDPVLQLQDFSGLQLCCLFRFPGCSFRSRLCQRRVLSRLAEQLGHVFVFGVQDGDELLPTLHFLVGGFPAVFHRPVQRFDLASERSEFPPCDRREPRRVHPAFGEFAPFLDALHGFSSLHLRVLVQTKPFRADVFACVRHRRGRKHVAPRTLPSHPPGSFFSARGGPRSFFSSCGVNRRRRVDGRGGGRRDGAAVGKKMEGTPESEYLMGNVLNGKLVADQIRKEIAVEVADLKRTYGKVPGLAVVIVGNRKDSQTYVRMKRKACAEVGMASISEDLPETITEAELIQKVRQLNANPAVHGILVQLPLPRHIDEEKVVSEISIQKDVDGFHPINTGTLSMKGRDPLFTPCTPLGCIELLKRCKVPIAGRQAVVIGRSNIVGMPAAMLLVKEDATVTICHSKTKFMERIVKEADIVIAGAGSPRLVKKHWVKPGAAVIDVGTNAVEDATKKSGYRLVGDVDFEGVKEVAGVLTPVPGGVGPMTIAMLLKNTLESGRRSMALSTTTKRSTEFSLLGAVGCALVFTMCTAKAWQRWKDRT